MSKRQRNDTMYEEALEIITMLQIGQSREIEMPDNLPNFRKYLCDIGKRTGKKCLTRIINGKLHIMRINYSNIYSKELE